MGPGPGSFVSVDSGLQLCRRSPTWDAEVQFRWSPMGECRMPLWVDLTFKSAFPKKNLIRATPTAQHTASGRPGHAQWRHGPASVACCGVAAQRHPSRGCGHRLPAVAAPWWLQSHGATSGTGSENLNEPGWLPSRFGLSHEPEGPASEHPEAACQQCAHCRGHSAGDSESALKILVG